MKSSLPSILWVVLALGCILFAGAVIGVSASQLSRTAARLRSDTVLLTAESPDHRRTVTVYQRDLGATTDPVTHVNLQPKYQDQFDPTQGTRILIIEGRHQVKVIWLANDHVELTYPFIGLFKTEPAWQDVKIKHTDSLHQPDLPTAP